MIKVDQFIKIIIEEVEKEYEPVRIWSDKNPPALLGTPRTPAHREDQKTVDTAKTSVWRQQDDTHPHACTDGVVYLTYIAFDESVGDEVEKIEVIPCRRCAEGRYVGRVV